MTLKLFEGASDWLAENSNGCDLLFSLIRSRVKFTSDFNQIELDDGKTKPYWNCNLNFWIATSYDSNSFHW